MQVQNVFHTCTVFHTICNTVLCTIPYRTFRPPSVLCSGTHQQARHIFRIIFGFHRVPLVVNQLTTHQSIAGATRHCVLLCLPVGLIHIALAHKRPAPPARVLSRWNMHYRVRGRYEFPGMCTICGVVPWAGHLHPHTTAEYGILGDDSHLETEGPSTVSSRGPAEIDKSVSHKETLSSETE